MKAGQDTLKRRADILDLLLEEGKVSVNDLSKKFDISEVSIRNDLKLLEKKGLLIKTRGGAIKAQPVNFDPSLNQRLRVNHAEKKRIGKKALDFIKDGYSIVIDSGSTAQEIARNLKQFNNIKLITNSLSIADICADNAGVEIIMLGGELRREMRSLIGPIAEKTLKNFNVDLAFIGADSISVEGGIYTPVVAEASLSRMMMRIAQKVIVVLDSSKFEQKSLVKISELNMVDVIITDKKVPKDALKKLNQMSLELVLV